MNPLHCVRVPRVGGSLISALRQRPLASSRLPLFPRRPTTTSTRLSSSIPPNGIIVPGPPPLPLFERVGHGISPFLRVIQAYGRAQNRRPYTTQLLTSITIYLLGDINAQLLFGEKDKPYDPIRTLRMLTIGSILSAPSYRWFLYLSNLFEPRFSKPVAVALRVMINQLCFTPVFLTAYFSLQSFLTGASAEETAERLQETLPTAYKNSCQLWPAVSAINFYWIKLEYRSVFSGVVAIGWNVYLSYLTQKAGAEELVGLEDVIPVPVVQEELTLRSIGEMAEGVFAQLKKGCTALVEGVKAAI